MSQPVLTPSPAPTTAAAPGVHLVRLPVDKSLLAASFLRARSRGVMDLIAHFWEGLAQTPPLQRPDLHLVAVIDVSNDQHINMSLLDGPALHGAMLYVPKAHRADILALHPTAAAALAAYIQHQGSKLAAAAPPPLSPAPDHAALAHQPVEIGHPVPSVHLTDFTGRQPQVDSLPLEVGGRTAVGPTSTDKLPTSAATTSNGSFPIDFLTGEAAAVGWITPLLLPWVHKRAPARQLVNHVMQLPTDLPAALNPHVRPARESDIPSLNRWRRLYKEERGILFDADMDALVQHQRVFVYELPAAPANEVVAVAKFDLELADLVEIGGVYTFPEHRHHGYGAALMSDLTHRIRHMGKTPTLQVDETNLPALRMYEKAGWQTMGRLARVWLTG